MVLAVCGSLRGRRRRCVEFYVRELAAMPYVVVAEALARDSLNFTCKWWLGWGDWLKPSFLWVQP